jgi:Tol biopolymer transport system component
VRGAPRRWLAAALLILLSAAIAAAPACATSPPQIVDFSPGRGATQVASNAPIRITFDRPMDSESVARRLHLVPEVTGQPSWENPRQLVYSHPPLRPAAAYEVVLEAGYRDSTGNPNTSTHHWPFRTEDPPGVASVTPAHHDGNVDPTALISVGFTRDVDITSLPAAISLTPSVPFFVRPDPGDARRALIAPKTLLEPDRAYLLTITRLARDVDGNQLGSGLVVSFTTGSVRPLKRALAFIAAPDGQDSNEGVWTVDENRIPRLLVSGPVQRFSWSGTGSRLLTVDAVGRWSDQSLGGETIELSFEADWAAFLAAGLGYVYRDEGRLNSVDEHGITRELAEAVGDVAVAPNGTRVAYTLPGPTGSEIWAYDIQLAARYRLQSEPGSIADLAWSPDGTRLAYRRLAADPAQGLLRVRNLAGAGGTTTIASGDLGSPTWQADSSHLIFTANFDLQGVPLSKVFRVSATGGIVRLDPANGLPRQTGLKPVSALPSPDGRQIAFLAGNPAQIWLMNADGTGLTQLTQFGRGEFPYSCSALSWSRS